MLTQRDDAGALHDAPILIAAPAVVSSALAEEADAMPGDPFDATWTDEEEKARAAVRDGTAVAAVLVDLRETPTSSSSVRGRTTASTTPWSPRSPRRAARDRTVEVQQVAEGEADAAARVRWFVLLCGLVGFGFVLVISLVRGPVASTWAGGESGGAGVASVAGAALCSSSRRRASGATLCVIAVGAGYAFTLGAIALAVEALTGLVGLVAMSAPTSSWPRRSSPAPVATCCPSRGQ